MYSTYLRNCVSGDFVTGGSHCSIDHDKIKMALVYRNDGVTDYAKLIADPSELQSAIADGVVKVIKTFCEYAKNGGEPQTSSVGYGPENLTGYSPMTDQFTLEDYNEALVSSIVKHGSSQNMYVLYVDEDNNIYGCMIDDEHIEGFPLNFISVNATPYSSSGSNAQVVVNFAHKDTKLSLEKANFIHSNFDLLSCEPLTPVTIVQQPGSASGSITVKIVESYGYYDVTALFGSANQLSNGIFTGVTAATYNKSDNTITLTASDNKWGMNTKPHIFADNGVPGYMWDGNKTLTDTL